MTTTRHWLNHAAFALRRDYQAACGAVGPLPLHFARRAFRVTCPICLPIARQSEQRRVGDLAADGSSIAMKREVPP